MVHKIDQLFYSVGTAWLAVDNQILCKIHHAIASWKLYIKSITNHTYQRTKLKRKRYIDLDERYRKEYLWKIISRLSHINSVKGLDPESQGTSSWLVVKGMMVMNVTLVPFSCSRTEITIIFVTDCCKTLSCQIIRTVTAIPCLLMAY